MIDCHVHTELSGHGSGTVGQMVGAGIFRGLSGMVITEHLPLPDGLDPRHHISMPPESLAPYAADVAQWARRAHDMLVVVGGEADWIPSREAECAAIRDAARSAGVAVLLGSVHFLDDWTFDDPHGVHLWDDKDVDLVYEQYFTQWCAAARSGLFDVMAHPDLVKKFGHRPSVDPADLYAEAAAAAREGGVFIEVSTAGLHKPVGELYPSVQMLATFCAAGVPVTVGSDAHATDEVGRDIDQAYAALTAVGYRTVHVPLGSGESRSFEL